MHHANHFYGHAHILARYAGLAEVPRIWGYLQHGWNTHDGFAVGTYFAPNFPKFVWADSVARRAWATGLRDVEVVGSPWAYLLKSEERYGDTPEPEREGTIVYPFHGWEQQNVIGSHDSYVRDIRRVEGDVPITICLYWNEFKDASVRRSYEDAGFRVISHGYRGHMWKGTDVHFLDKQLDELRRHKRVVSNRLGSALIYGASVGADIGIYGDPMILQAERAALGGREKQIRLYQQLHQPFVPRDYAQRLARYELGQDVLLTPRELRSVLGWEDARQAVPGTAPLASLSMMAGSGMKGHEKLARIPTDDQVMADPEPAPGSPADDTALI
ncbi:hypothetical protein [Allobranchiibius sp. CTAmp26]|uniref:hypothetical protein n=1 Tax=Allobranchiibius sp. CTAmp26 TaxID=2815214 RepID=UPI001AA1C57A|nr:hypothetical protein [Allobranchiibius sp. CTAmp26]MBO1755630.1 hypothetical protein [Allobranchiibius sp. CTAmp26]